MIWYDHDEHRKWKTYYKRQLLVNEIIENCSIGNSKIDISFLSPDGRWLLGLIEAKNTEGSGIGGTQKPKKQSSRPFAILSLLLRIVSGER